VGGIERGEDDMNGESEVVAPILKENAKLTYNALVERFFDEPEI